MQVGPKRRRLQKDNDILGPVQRQEVQEATLVQRLNEYVERIDTDMVSVNMHCALHAEMHASVLLIVPHTHLLQRCLALSVDACLCSKGSCQQVLAWPFKRDRQGPSSVRYNACRLWSTRCSRAWLRGASSPSSSCLALLRTRMGPLCRAPAASSACLPVSSEQHGCSKYACKSSSGRDECCTVLGSEQSIAASCCHS